VKCEAANNPSIKLGAPILRPRDTCAALVARQTHPLACFVRAGKANMGWAAGVVDMNKFKLQIYYP
jgi:hypothetical protein